MFTLAVSSIVSAQNTGDTPYIYHFGINQTEENSGAHVKVTNRDQNDMVIALVGRYTDDVYAHAFIKSGDTYTFYNLPTGPYSYKFSNAGSYFENRETIKLQGCNSDRYPTMCSLSERPYEWSWEVWVERSQRTDGPSGRISKEQFFDQ